MDLRAALRKFHQHVQCPTSGSNTLDKVYTNIKEAYRPLPCPSLGKSDHLSLFLLPAYKPLIRKTKPAIKMVKRRPKDATLQLQDCFDCTDWDLFAQQATSGTEVDLEEYTSTVLSYINCCVEFVTVDKQIKMFPNRKPWMNKEVQNLLSARNIAFKSRNTSAYSAARSNLNKGIKKAKDIHRQRVEDHFNTADTRSMWQGVRDITDYKSSPICPHSDNTLANELNTFFARFETGNTTRRGKTQLGRRDRP